MNKRSRALRCVSYDQLASENIVGMAKEGLGLEMTELRLGLPGSDEMKRKNVTVGWPPVSSYRRKNSLGEKDVMVVDKSKMYVKVSMDGAPFLRKIDLATHKSYSDLAVALLGCFGDMGETDKAVKEEYVPIYQDKDGDWMLAGDVPWEMFTESCKRLRLMKRSDVKGFGKQSGDFLEKICGEKGSTK